MIWILDWVWQGLALALLVSGALRLVRSLSASTRYVIWWGCMLVVLALPVTWLRTGVEAPAAAGRGGAGVLDAAAAVPVPPDWLIAGAIGVWLGFVMLRLSKVAGAFCRLRRVEQRFESFPAARAATLRRWQAVRASGRRARLCLSRELAVASVFGYRRPTIVIPDGLAAALSDDELDQVIVHEHGHVRRWDDWAKLAQTLIAAVACFHPAIWWIGSALDLEREVACDDWALAHDGSVRAYATCLTKIAGAGAAHGDHALVPGAVGRGPSLAARVVRLLDVGRNSTPRVSFAGVCGGGGSLAVAILLMAPFAPAIVIGLSPAVTDTAAPPPVARSRVVGSRAEGTPTEQMAPVVVAALVAMPALETVPSGMIV